MKTCQGHNYPCKNPGKRRRQNTQYEKEEDNWVFMCEECFDFRQEEWEEMWRDYYRGVL